MEPSFSGLRVLSLESRRAAEIGTLIARFGGQPTVAPALKETPIDGDAEAAAFGRDLVEGRFDVIVFLTGVGAKLLLDGLGRSRLATEALDALRRTPLVVRGPKPAAALRERGLTPAISAADPFTWREVVDAIEAAPQVRLRGARVALQEYGAPNPELVDALEARGASVRVFHAYTWALPDDVAPLEGAVHALCEGRLDVVLITSGVQMRHLLTIADRLGRSQDTRAALGHLMVASIGPATSAELQRLGVPPDVEASPPRMGMLIRLAAKRASSILEAKGRKRL
jgi:uroporphyrinogen-III synthase